MLSNLCRRFLAAILMPCIVAIAATAQPNDIASVAATQMKQYDIDGAILVAHDGNVLYEAGFGPANREWNVANTPDTRFRIASMTKSFTAVLIMQLVQAGQLELGAPFGRYLPDYPADYARRITVQHLLTHSSGIPHYAELPGWRQGKYRATNSSEDFVNAFAAQPLNFEPGTNKRYSNSNYYLLGKIIEKLTDAPYATALRDRILTPLKMNDTGDFSSGEIIPKFASDYMKNGEEISCTPQSADYCKSGFVNMVLFTATGSMHSTTQDILKWDRGLYGTVLLSEESKAIMFNPEDPFAWEVGNLPIGKDGSPVPVISYNGGISGYTSIIARFPESKHTIIILNNNGSGYNKLAQAAVSIAQALLN